MMANENLPLVLEYYISDVLELPFTTDIDRGFRVFRDPAADSPVIEYWDDGAYGAKPDVSTVMAHEAAWQAQYVTPQQDFDTKRTAALAAPDFATFKTEVIAMLDCLRDCTGLKLEE
jgi:hypothetical protein